MTDNVIFMTHDRQITHGKGLSIQIVLSCVFKNTQQYTMNHIQAEKSYIWRKHSCEDFSHVINTLFNEVRLETVGQKYHVS